MDRSILTFSADNQKLAVQDCKCFAAETINYIEAHFELGENWGGFDSVRAVWANNWKTISTVLDSEGNTVIPHEVLSDRSEVLVNLVGSIVVDGAVSDRLTTCQIKALEIGCKAIIDGSETGEITPSQFEQFVANVKADADRAEDARDDAEEFANEAESWADRAEQSSANAGYMFFHINEDGDLICQRTPNTQVDFYLQDGDLFVEAING